MKKNKKKTTKKRKNWNREERGRSKDPGNEVDERKEQNLGVFQRTMQTFVILFLTLKSIIGKLFFQRSAPMAPALLPDKDFKHSRPRSPIDSEEPPLKHARIDESSPEIKTEKLILKTDKPEKPSVEFGLQSIKEVNPDRKLTSVEKPVKIEEPLVVEKSPTVPENEAEKLHKGPTKDDPPKEEKPAKFKPPNETKPAQFEPPKEAKSAKFEPPKEAKPAEVEPSKEAKPAKVITPNEAKPAKVEPPKEGKHEKDEPPKEAKPTKVEPPKDRKPAKVEPPKQAKPVKDVPPKKEKLTIEERLRSFGYHFVDDELRDIKTNGKFEFNVHKNHADNQKRYEALGQVIDEYVYFLLEKETKLKKLQIPFDAGVNDGRGFIFHSDDAFDCDRLMLIIHGAGVVRAGQWARRLIINHSLTSGTQLPYIKKAKEEGYGVLVLNSNHNYDEEKQQKIKGNGSPEAHFNYVWSEIVRKRCKAQHVAIVAHSYGGHITVQGALNNADVIEKTFAVAFTDSVHYSSSPSAPFQNWMGNHVCNWVSNGAPLDSKLQSRDGGCMRVSAGTSVHEETSWKAFRSVWKFFDDQWKERMKKTEVSENDKHGNDEESENSEHEEL